MNLRRVLLAFAALTAGNVLGSNPLEPVLLTQHAPGGLILAPGANANGDLVYVGASSDAETCDPSLPYTLEVEVRPADTAFSDVPTHTSAVLAKPSCVRAEYPVTALGGLTPGAYKWQARESVGGSPGRWVPFNGGLAAFAVPDIAVSPSSVAFGPARTGTQSATRAVEITNLTPETVTISRAAVSGPFAILGGQALPLALSPGGKAIFTLAATPVAAGASGGSFTVESTHPSSPHLASLTAFGTEPHLELATGAVAFGEVVIGAGASTKSATLRNTGAAALTVNGVTVGSPFSAGGLAGVRLAPGAEHSFTIHYAPTTPGAHASTLSIASDDPGGPRALSLSGSGTEPVIAPNQPALLLSSASHDFGALAVGGLHTAEITLSNVGDAALNVSGVALDGAQAQEFQVESPLVPFTVAAGGSARVGVRFSPAAVGPRSAALRIESDKYPAGVSTVALSGWGHGPKLTVASTAVDFGAVNVEGTTVRTIDVRNDGSASATVNGISFHGGAAVDFRAIQSAPFTVPPGGLHTVSVAFSPATAGPRVSLLAVSSDDPVTPAIDVALAGVGLWPEAAPSPSVVTFGKARLGQRLVQSVAIRNTGNGPLTVAAVTVTGTDGQAFTVSGVMTPLTLQPGAPAIFAQVSFQPSAVGTASAELALASDDVDSPTMTVPLSGEGIAPQLAISAPAVDFGPQLVNRPSAPRTVVITNSGTAPLAVSAISLAGVAASSYAITTPAAPFSLDAGESRAISLVATPRLVGELTARLVLTTDAPGAAAAQVKLSALGLSRALSVTPSSIDFGLIKAGAVRGGIPVTFHNGLSETVSLGAARLTGPNGDQFSVQLDASHVGPRGSVTAFVTYRPLSAGVHSATLLLGPADSPAASVQLSGTAASRILAASPSSFDFAPTLVGTAAEQVFTLTNKTAEPLTVATLRAIGPEFTLRTTAPLTVPGGQSVELTVAFAPRAEGLAYGVVAIALAGQEVDRPELTIALSGTGFVAEPARSGCAAAGMDLAAGAWLALAAALALNRRRSRRRGA